MKAGVQISSFTWPGGDGAIGQRLARIGAAADEAGFDSFWVMDHFFQIQHVGAPDEPMLEGYTALAFVAGKTERITLGTLVTGVIYRTAALLVKAVTTLDVLSGGRAWMGIGAGWNEDEAIGLGFRFPPTRERFEQLEETLTIAHHMWSGDRSPVHGKHFVLENPISSPQPVSKPHPRILIGGSGEKKTLRLVAQHADACNLFAMGPEAVSAKLDVLKQHCADVGRDYDAIEKTLLMRVDPASEGAEAILVRCRDYASIGIDHVIFSVGNVHEIEPLRVMGRDVLPAMAEITTR